jgi:hypothetical protein
MQITADQIKTAAAIMGTVAALFGGGTAIKSSNERDQVLEQMLSLQERTWNAGIEACRQRAFERRAEGKDNIVPRADSLPFPAEELAPANAMVKK